MLLNMLAWQCIAEQTDYNGLGQLCLEKVELCAVHNTQWQPHPPSAGTESVTSAPKSVSKIWVGAKGLSSVLSAKASCWSARPPATALRARNTATCSCRPNSSRCCAAYRTQMLVQTALARRLLQTGVLRRHNSRRRMRVRGV